MYITYNIILYFYIGYTYMCWTHYRVGAGFNVNPYIHDFFDELALVVLFGIVLWPITISIHASMNIYMKFNLKVITSKMSPESFYKRGEHDNNADVQAEKHLLGVK